MIKTQARRWLDRIEKYCEELKEMNDDKLDSIKDGLQRVADDLQDAILYFVGDS